MSNRTLHYFDADGKEVPEGDVASVVQYDEATAERMGFKFKASDEKEAESESLADRMKAAAVDGSEPDAEPVKAVSAKAVAEEPKSLNAAAKKADEPAKTPAKAKG